MKIITFVFFRMLRTSRECILLHMHFVLDSCNFADTVHVLQYLTVKAGALLWVQDDAKQGNWMHISLIQQWMSYMHLHVLPILHYFLLSPKYILKQTENAVSL